MVKYDKAKRSQSEWVLREMLKVAIEDKRTSAEYYRRLGSLAHQERDRRRIFDIAKDEQHMERILSKVYKNIFGVAPGVEKGRMRKLYRFDESVGKSVADEYESISFFKEILSRTDSEECKSVLRRVMDADQQHAHILENILGFCRG